MFQLATNGSIDDFREMKEHIHSFDGFCEKITGTRLLPTTCEVFNEATFGNCVWKANITKPNGEPNTNNHLVLTVGESWRYLGAIHRLARLKFPCPLPVGSTPAFQLDVFYCYKWWEVGNAEHDSRGGSACVQKLPGYIIPGMPSLFSPWFPIEQAVPNNVVTVPSVLDLMIRDPRTRKRRRESVDIEFICVLGRSNMVPGSLISTTFFE
ncbi:Uncharacterized protein PBTT_03618 [Plasmodiophora brassicae]